MAASRLEPPSECDACPRLAAFRAASRVREPAWHNAPVPAFGGLDARLLVVGLAPGLRGANATGRPFTGDFAGELLYATLLKFGFASGHYGATADDGLRLVGTRITNAVRCVPPQNKPVGTEIRQCGGFLEREIAAMTRLACIVTLGAIAHGATCRALGIKVRAAPFGHGREFKVTNGPTVIGSYHCSRLNTNTGRLTVPMFEDIFAAARHITGG